MSAAKEIEGSPTKRRGWMAPYLVESERLFGHGRLGWWARVDAEGELPEEPIPFIPWRESNDTRVRGELADLSADVAEKRGWKEPLSAEGARKHLMNLVGAMGAGWESLTYLIRWIAWGLNVRSEAPRSYTGEEGWDELLYRKFELGRLVAADADVLGSLLSERHGKNWNPAAFYPTPAGVCQLMAEMTMSDYEGKDRRLASVVDPCVGTGRMLLAASNYSVNLWGVDIDPLVVDACAINLAMFAPWGVYLTPRHRAVLGRPGPTLSGDQQILESANQARQEQGHEPLPSTGDADDKRFYQFDRKGQGELFSGGES